MTHWHYEMKIWAGSKGEGNFRIWKELQKPELGGLPYDYPSMSPANASFAE